MKDDESQPFEWKTQRSILERNKLVDDFKDHGHDYKDAVDQFK